MLRKTLVRKCTFLYFLFFINTSTTLKNSKLLKSLLGKTKNGAVVIVLEVDNSKRTSDFDDLLDDHNAVGLLDYENNKEIFKQDKDSNANILQRLLRSNPDDSDDSLESIKQVLRTALRTRCEKVYKCVQICPKKKPSCPANCQQIFDELDICRPKPKPKPDPCNKKPKCGKTMPPNWYL